MGLSSLPETSQTPAKRHSPIETYPWSLRVPFHFCDKNKLFFIINSFGTTIVSSNLSRATQHYYNKPILHLEITKSIWNTYSKRKLTPGSVLQYKHIVFSLTRFTWRVLTQFLDSRLMVQAPAVPPASLDR